jgi:hypothetical protein
VRGFVKRVRRAVLAGGFVCFAPVAIAAAQGTIGTITVGAAPGTLIITTAVAGMDPTGVSGSSTYTVKAKQANKPQKVTGQLNAAMPAGVTLTVTLAAPTGGAATSNGAVALDATARDLVGNITNTTNQTLAMTYNLSATAAAGVIANQNRTVTFTILAWP